MRTSRILQCIGLLVALAAIPSAFGAGPTSATESLVLRIEPRGPKTGAKLRIALLRNGASLQLSETDQPVEFRFGANIAGGLLVEASGAGQKVFVSAMVEGSDKPHGVTATGHGIVLNFGGDGPSIRAFGE